MRRLFSISKKPSPYDEGYAGYSDPYDHDHWGSPSVVAPPTDFDQLTEASTVQASPPPVNLTIKRVDHFYSKWSKKWKYQNSGSKVRAEYRQPAPSAKDDPWAQYCFVVIRKMRKIGPPHFRIVIRSEYLRMACTEVIKGADVNWGIPSLELDPKLFITFLPRFQSYRDELSANKKPTEEDKAVIATVDVLIDYIRTDYCETLASIKNLTSRGEITLDLLYAILVPGTIMVTKNTFTGEIEAMKLLRTEPLMPWEGYRLILENFDRNEHGEGFRMVEQTKHIHHFSNTVRIDSLSIYPIQFHPKEDQLRQTLIARGKKWKTLATGVHHMAYKGNARNKPYEYVVDSRVIIDRASFFKCNIDYSYFHPSARKRPGSPDNWGTGPINTPGMNPHPNPHLGSFSDPYPNNLDEEAPAEFKAAENEEDLLIAPSILYGFSLSDKLWLEMNIAHVKEIVWNEEAFTHLVLPQGRKTMLKSLVEAHTKEVGFDDFIKGKGRGLVVTLFGPPGVGKTLSAEATSEHVKRPLYVVAAGDLGTTASDLDVALRRVFELATLWKAIVLIDEADVFLEQRSLHDLERNAMIAVFLRHLEYYPAILFLTTNRVKVFDQALLSRIHLALHFHNLTQEARKSVWASFLAKAHAGIGMKNGISEEELTKLSEKDINGRQIKNVTKTANSLAISRGETLTCEHLLEVLEVMEQFVEDFENMKITQPESLTA